MQGQASERTLSIQRPQAHTTNPGKEKKEKIVGDKNKEQIRPTGSIGELLKPASPTPSNTGSLRSFQRDTEECKGSAVLRSSTARNHK